MLFFTNNFWFQIFSWKTFYTLHNDNSIYVIFNVEKTFNASSCNMCGKYTKNHWEIRKHYAKTCIHFNFGLYFDISSLSQKIQIIDFRKIPLIRNVGSQPLYRGCIIVCILMCIVWCIVEVYCAGVLLRCVVECIVGWKTIPMPRTVHLYSV